MSRKVAEEILPIAIAVLGAWPRGTHATVGRGVRAVGLQLEACDQAAGSEGRVGKRPVGAQVAVAEVWPGGGGGAAAVVAAALKDGALRLDRSRVRHA